jgi:hypothetical protein
MSVDPTTGDVTVTCRSTTPPPPGALGTISLSTTKYLGAKATSTTPAIVGISVMRLNGNTGPLNGTLAVTVGTCTLAYNDVSFAAGDAITKVVNLTSPSAGTSICTVTLTSTLAPAALVGSTTTATVDIADASAPPPPIAGCPATPGNVVIGTLATQGLALRVIDKARIDGLGPTIYSYPLPHNASGQVQSSSSPDTPPSMTVQMSISKCPGDFDSAKTDPTLTFRWPWGGNPSFPCSTLGSAESTVIRWDSVLSSSNCPATVTSTWYVNIRLTDSLGAYSCPVASATGPGCPFIFSWN